MTKTHQNNIVLRRSTAEKLKELLDLVNIMVVYYVDDENNPTDFDIQIVAGELEKIYGLEKEAELAEVRLDSWDRTLPKDETIEALRALWPGVELENKKRIYSQIISISKSDGENILDFNRATMVGSQIPKDRIRVLSPQQWDVEKKKIINQLKDDEKALVLFDEELKHAGLKYSSIRGQDLIVEIKKMGLKDKVICTLLTHKISSAKDELKFRDDIIRDRVNQDLNDDDFFALAKQRLDEPEVFADGIKKALINKYFETIKKYTIEIIVHSYQEAIKKIRSFDTYDFDATILKTSVNDGIWEPETIIRISDIVFENEIKSRMVETDYALKVNDELKLAQKFSEIEFTWPENMQPYSDKLILRNQEIYDPGNLINPLRKPLENGDIFQLGNSQYILVAQACDMAVRKKEGKVGLRNSKVATLLKINPITSDHLHKKLKEPGNYFSNRYLLDYFKAGTTEKGIVEFTDYVMVDIDYLDLCVFNKDGECKINLQNLENRDYLSRIWESRYDIIIQKIESFQIKISKIRKYLQPGAIMKFLQLISFKIFRRKRLYSTKIENDYIEKEFYPKFILASSNIIGDLVRLEMDGTFTFSTKRISKYKNYGATNLLESYTRHLSRSAELHDFAK